MSEQIRREQPTGKRMGGPMRGPMGHGGMGGEKAKDFRGTFKKLLQHLKPYRVSLVIVVLFAMISSGFSIVAPKILGKLTTKIYEGLVSSLYGGENAGIDFSYILYVILWLIGIYLVSALFSFLQGYIVSGVAQKVSYGMRKEISEKINRLPLKYFDTRTYGEVLSRVTNDVDTVSQTLNQGMSQIVISVTTLIGIIIMMFSISWIMTLAAFLVFPLSMLFISIIIKKSQKYFAQQQEYLGYVNGHVEEIFGGHIIMKAFNGEKKAEDTFEKMNDKLYDSALKSQFLSGMLMPIMSFIGNLGYVAVCILGGWLAIKKTIEVGDILSFVQYVRRFNQPIMQVAQISNVLQSTAAASERVFEFLEEEEEIPNTSSPLTPEEATGKVTFSHVHFGYNPEKIIIRDFNADIKPGQKIAIVGPTGAGKTTIVKLLMRFYELNDGAIFIDGHDIRAFKREDLRNMFGMVLQDAWLYNGTIMDNIRYGKLTATDDEVIAAAKAAHAHGFIKTLPNGYDMELNEEASNVSLGQKQLLTIARAFLADPKILILDEATSSVDTRTEILIQRAMDNLMKGRTSFVIAHRLSTIRDADMILVLKDGDIVEQGRHEELLAANGFYASLYYSQFEVKDAG